jgi:hypothetical protein
MGRSVSALKGEPPPTRNDQDPDPDQIQTRTRARSEPDREKTMGSETLRVRGTVADIYIFVYI